MSSSSTEALWRQVWIALAAYGQLTAACAVAVAVLMGVLAAFPSDRH